jgi:hypothetical protein
LNIFFYSFWIAKILIFGFIRSHHLSAISKISKRSKKKSFLIAQSIKRNHKINFANDFVLCCFRNFSKKTKVYPLTHNDNFGAIKMKTRAILKLNFDVRFIK